MKRFTVLILTILLIGIRFSHAGPISSAARETAEWIAKKFGTGRVGKTVDEIAVATARTIEKHGNEALPLLRSAGHAGFEALESAGKQAPDVIKLFARCGDEAVWVISKPNKLAIFLKHGDNAADALLKHPGIADDLIERFGGKVLAPLNQLEKTGAQQLAMAAKEGVLEATPRSSELFDVIAKFGDRAMDFIWRNKGALTVATVLASFLNNPELFINTGKDLVVETAIKPLASNLRWDWLGYGATALISIGGIILFRRVMFRKKSS